MQEVDLCQTGNARLAQALSFWTFFPTLRKVGGWGGRGVNEAGTVNAAQIKKMSHTDCYIKTQFQVIFIV